jgi:GH24 family phage-related lysozyme (muramidase)
LLGYIGKFGILGLAISTGVGILKEYAEGLEGINRASATLGTAGTNIKNVVDQLKAVGASDKDALKEVNKFVETSNELLRQNSAARQEFMQHAADPAASRAFLDAMDKAQTLEDRMNLAREAAGRVFQNRLELDRQLGKSTETALQDATAARNAFLEALGMTPEVEARLKGAFRKMSEEQQRTNEDVLKRGEKITKMWNDMGAAATRAKDRFLDASRVLREEMKTTSEVDKQLRDKYGPQNFFDRLNPFSPRNIEREKRLLPWLHPDAPTPDLGDQLGIKGIPKGNGDLFAPGLEPQYFSGGSTHIEDRRNEGQLLADNTKELKQLNDNLFAMLHPVTGGGAPGGVAAGAPGGGPGGAGGPGGGTAPGGGAAPIGSNGGDGGDGAKLMQAAYKDGGAAPAFRSGGGYAVQSITGGGSPSGGTAPSGGGLGAAGLPQSYLAELRKQENAALASGRQQTSRAEWDYHQWSIGYGTKSHRGEVINREEAERRLNTEVSASAKAVDRMNPNLDPGTRAALVDLHYNGGQGALNGISGLIRSGDVAGIRQKLLHGYYARAGGRPNAVLARRRAIMAGFVGHDFADGGGGAPGTISPEAVSAVGGVPPKAFIMHHTGGGGTVAGLQATLRGRHLGVEYAMDREGNIR